MTRRIEAALRYASWGWRVLPVVAGGKAPATAHGVRDATTDATQIVRWWTDMPDANIGVAAGEASGIIVYDIDPRNGGDDAWHEWQQHYGRVPDGAVQLTAGGGQHYLALWQAGIRSAKLGHGIDLLSDGRYFLVSPSTIDGRRYEWEGSSDPADGVSPFPIPDTWQEPTRLTRRLVNVAADGGLIRGSRNDGLTALGGAMRRHGMTEAEILAALSVANETRCEIPLPASEVSQIARSVARYQPDSDMAANAGAGNALADAILAAVKAESSDYYLSRATALIAQPSPLRWLVKGWLPADGLSMIYGESGAGKTFIALDIACHIATGRDWYGRKVRPGIVVYLAGEGHYGLRLRIASWARHHLPDDIDNLLVSSRSVDMDAPGGAEQIIRAVREITAEPISLIIIDTLHTHMQGDENSAQDTRAMLNACMIAGRALSASVCLVHHTGHAEAAKGRARGSSAWRAALDSSIQVSKRSEAIEISCTKMKDAEPLPAMWGRLQAVHVGWIDDEGQPVSGAVYVYDPRMSEVERPGGSGIGFHIRRLANAWRHGGQERTPDGQLLIRRDVLMRYLVEVEGCTASTADTYTRPGRRGKLVADLLAAEIIRATPGGWIVASRNVAMQMAMDASVAD